LYYQYPSYRTAAGQGYRHCRLQGWSDSGEGTPHGEPSETTTDRDCNLSSNSCHDLV